MKNNSKAVLAAAVLMATGLLTPLPPARGMDALDAPETVNIDSLADLYKPVTFSHVRHSKLARCKDCHHHTTGHVDMDPNCVRCHAHSPEAKIVSCAKCHTKRQFFPEQVAQTDNPNIYHIDKPGLKGAYHLNCIPCHQKKNAPTGCTGCHDLTEKGKDFFHLQAAMGSDTNAKGHDH